MAGAFDEYFPGLEYRVKKQNINTFKFRDRYDMSHVSFELMP